MVSVGERPYRLRLGSATGPLTSSWCQDEGMGRPYCIFFPSIPAESATHTPWAILQGPGAAPSLAFPGICSGKSCCLVTHWDAPGKRLLYLGLVLTWCYQGKFFHIKKENCLSSVCMAWSKQGGVSAAVDAVMCSSVFVFCVGVNLGRRPHHSVQRGSRVL